MPTIVSLNYTDMVPVPPVAKRFRRGDRVTWQDRYGTVIEKVSGAAYAFANTDRYEIVFDGQEEVEHHPASEIELQKNEKKPVDPVAVLEKEIEALKKDNLEITRELDKERRDYQDRISRLHHSREVNAAAIVKKQNVLAELKRITK